MINKKFGVTINGCNRVCIYLPRLEDDKAQAKLILKNRRIKAILSRQKSIVIGVTQGRESSLVYEYGCEGRKKGNDAEFAFNIRAEQPPPGIKLRDAND